MATIEFITKRVEGKKKEIAKLEKKMERILKAEATGKKSERGRRKTVTYTEIQEDIVRRFRVDLCDGTKCRSDWSRTHAHVKQRRVCK